jgi:hypothetical protein
MKVTIDCYTGHLPKRGDILQTNLGGGRNRTRLILQVHRLKPTKAVPRCRAWAERWWEVEPEMRLKLFASAERNGGQEVLQFKRYPPKKRFSFEQYLGRDAKGGCHE